MLTIRKEQIEVFEQMSMNSFIKDMVDHVRKHFPEVANSMEQKSLNSYIFAIINKAKKYELISERDICKFINLCMIYGKDFETNIETVWIHNRLLNKEESNPSIRLNDCYKDAIERLEKKEAGIKQ